MSNRPVSVSKFILTVDSAITVQQKYILLNEHTWRLVDCRLQSVSRVYVCPQLLASQDWYLQRRPRSVYLELFPHNVTAAYSARHTFGGVVAFRVIAFRLISFRLIASPIGLLQSPNRNRTRVRVRVRVRVRG